MMFQVGIITALIGGLFGVALLRRLIQRCWPKLSDARLDVALCFLLAAGLIAAEIDHYVASRELWRAQHQIHTLGLQFTVNFTVDWKKGEIPDRTNWVVRGSGTRACSAEFILSSGKPVTVEFHDLQKDQFMPGEANTTTITYFTSALPGADIYAVQPQDIESIRQFGFTCIFGPRELDTPLVTFHRMSAVLYVNGERSFSVEKVVEITLEYANEKGQGSWFVIKDFGKVSRL